MCTMERSVRTGRKFPLQPVAILFQVVRLAQAAKQRQALTSRRCHRRSCGWSKTCRDARRKWPVWLGLTKERKRSCACSIITILLASFAVTRQRNMLDFGWWRVSCQRTLHYMHCAADRRFLVAVLAPHNHQPAPQARDVQGRPALTNQL